MGQPTTFEIDDNLNQLKKLAAKAKKKNKLLYYTAMDAWYTWDTFLEKIKISQMMRYEVELRTPSILFQEINRKIRELEGLREKFYDMLPPGSE